MKEQVLCLNGSTSGSLHENYVVRWVVLVGLPKSGRDVSLTICLHWKHVLLLGCFVQPQYEAFLFVLSYMLEVGRV